MILAPIRIATRIAALVAIVVFLVLPAGHFFLKFNAIEAGLVTEGRMKAEVLSQLVTSRPDVWAFQEDRLHELLARRKGTDGNEMTCVFDFSGTEIACHGESLADPTLVRATPIFDSGRPAGKLEMRVSLRKLVFETGVVALLAAVLGVLVFGALRFLPARALDRALTALRHEQGRAKITLRSIGDAVITTDAEETITYLNPVAEQLTGWRSEDAIGRPSAEVFVLVDELTGGPVASPLGVALAEKRIVPLANHTALKRKDGGIVPIEDSAAPITDDDGTVLGGVLVFHDVSATRKLSRELSWQATHDALTGLKNRVEFDRVLDGTVMSARADNSQHAVCYIDLDQFKVVNDTCGHTAGDELLKQMAILLAPRVRKSDTLARLGGDEFGLLLHGCSIARAQEIAEGILEDIKTFRFSWGDKVFRIGASIGIAGITALSSSGQRVLSGADSACYSAKESGRGRIHSFRYDDQDIGLRREQMNWVTEINTALDEGRFCFYYQPYRGLTARAQTGLHLELLIRMVDVNGKIIGPNAFIPAAERYTLASAIDRWVVTTAFKASSQIQARFGNDTVIGINISGASFSEELFPNFVIEAARLSGIRTSSFCIEITESAAINDLKHASAFIRQLRAAGFKFALDDFGAGMSSFGYLRNLPVDFLKIDGALVRDMVEDMVSFSMVKAINEIARAMSLRTIAEFAEDERTIKALREVGVDFAQGYGVARPAPLSDALSEHVPRKTQHATNQAA